MKKEEVYKLLENFGIGEFLEEVQNSYDPEPSLKVIFDRIRSMPAATKNFNGKKVEMYILDLTNLANALYCAKDLFSTSELNRLLEYKYNLDPLAVGGADIFFNRLGDFITSVLEDIKREWS
jgi:hypothetical protein